MEGSFGGHTYVPEHDLVRLTGALKAVREIMADGKWRTLAELRFDTGEKYTESNLSARLRDLRKEIFGGLTVELRRRGDPKRGIHEYRVSPEKGQC